MAKLNKTGTTILWRMELTQRGESGTETIRRYALRSDGVLLGQVIIDLHDRRHNYGWKRAALKPYPDVKERLAKVGYRQIA